MRFLILSLLLVYTTISHGSGLPKDLRTYHDSIFSLVDSTVVIPIPASATSATLEVRFTMPDTHISACGERKLSLLWNIMDSVNYSALSVSYGRDGFDNTFDRDFAVISLRRVTSSVDTLLYSERVESPFAITAAENSLAVTLSSSGRVVLLFGHPLPEEIASLADRFDPRLPLGISAYGPVNLPLVVTDVALPAVEGLTEVVYSPDDIEQLLAPATYPSNSPAGIWEYLDRDTDNVRARSGGHYRLAVLPSASSSGYDIVYLGGAEVNPSAWRPGMIKGRLIPTPFAGHFDLMWVDSSFNPISEDIHASLDSSNAILTLSFPLMGSSIRFYRP